MCRRHVKRWASPVDSGVGCAHARCLLDLAGEARQPSVPEDAHLFELLHALCRLCSIRNYKMLLYVASCLGELQGAIEDLGSFISNRPSTIASFFVSCGAREQSLEGMAKNLNVRKETLYEVFKVLGGDVMAVIHTVS